MKKSIQMKQALEVLRNEAKALIDNKDAKIEDIQAKNVEIATLQAKIPMQEALEAQEQLDAENAAELLEGSKPVPKTNQIKEFINGLRTKFQNSMSEGVPADGGYTVPQDIQTKINELRQSKDALQNFVTVEPVTAPTGSRVFKARSQQTGFAEVLEEGIITEKAVPQFTILSYAVKKYAGFLKVTNELLSDSDAAITGIITKWLGDESRVTRNKLILAALGLKARTAIADVDAIKGILNITLDAAFRNTSTITTNQDGFNWLDTLVDTNGDYLLQPNVTAPTGKQLFGVPVVMISNQDLPTVATKAPMIIGDLKESVVLFNNMSTSIRSSDVAGDSFTTDMTLFRAIEREEVKVRDAAAYVYGEITIV